MDTVLSTTSEIFLHHKDISEIDGFLRLIENVLSDEECRRIIDLAEEKKFVAASLYTDKEGTEYFSETRKSSRCIIDSAGFAEQLWIRLKQFVPSTWKNGEVAVGINHRLRILRYDPGDEFKPHSDGSYTDQKGNTSKITILIYLNSGYDGGHTAFLSNDADTWISIFPRTGLVAMQDQTLLHCVPPLVKGRKYVLRTEVMYGVKTNENDSKIVKIYKSTYNI